MNYLSVLGYIALMPFIIMSGIHLGTPYEKQTV